MLGCGLLSFSPPGSAAEPQAPVVPHFEFSAGGQAFDRVWSLYTGITAAPFGSIQADGWRLRAAAGYGGYSYSGRRPVGTTSTVMHFDGTVASAELLLGYQKQFGPLTLKAFGGLTTQDHRLRPDDPETSIRGDDIGAKAVVEAWWTINDQLWASADLGWASLHDEYGTRLRLGWRWTPALSIGLEAGAAGNVESDVGRAGAFVRYEWATGELSVSAGMSSDAVLDSFGAGIASGSAVPFVTANWLTRF